MLIEELMCKSRDGGTFTREELITMLNFPSAGAESFRIMAEASRVARELTEEQGEVHAQFALNLAPCPCYCAFCSFAVKNGIFQEESRISPETAVANARQFERDGANAIYVMTTAHYPFELFLEMSQEIRRHLQPETVMIANVGDQPPSHCRQLREAGYNGAYHALRLREGVDTSLSPLTRKASIRNFQEAGLVVGTCVEPIGPEHSNEELVDAILFNGSFNPAFSGAARRITIPGTEIAARGMISELRMAQIVAVTRLGTPRSVLGNCTHEPCTLGAIAGANLFWAEVGANPRDVKEKTEEGRGESVASCAKLYNEAGWQISKGASRFYTRP
jgi:biotin synthase